MSEKMDGIRIFWDGKQLFLKNGNLLIAPDYFIQGLPLIPLDGELWLGRNIPHKQLVDIVNNKDANWGDIKLVIFDLPTSKQPYQVRLNELKGLTLPSHVCIVHTEECQSLQHLEDKLTSILNCGGEGLMLNDPRSVYTTGRTTSLLKFKV
jgi:DNA ligase-1